MTYTDLSTLNPSEKTLSLLNAKGVSINGKTLVWGDWETPKEQPLPPEYIAQLRAKHVRNGTPYSPNLERAKMVFDLMKQGENSNMVVRKLAAKGFGEAMVRIDMAAYRAYLEAQKKQVENAPTLERGKAPKSFIML